MHSRTLVFPLVALAVGAVLWGGASSAGAQATVPGSLGADGSGDSTVVQRLVREALENNRSLKQERIALDQRRAALDQARGQYLPSLDLQARYTRARGGRTIDFPVGDLINPAYRGLEETTGRSFPRLANREIAFLRGTEQNTTLQLRQPLFQPKILYGTRARRHTVEAQQAAVEARRRTLARDVQVAYFRFRKAQARVDILEATRTRVREHLRTSRRLLAAATVTKDAVHRAEVEVLDVRQRLADAQSARDHARRRLNVLCNRQTTAPIPAPTTDVDRLIAQRRRAVEQALGRAFSDSDAVAVAPGAVGAPERAVVAGTEATGGGRGGPEGAEWISRRATERPRLARLDAAADAADDRRRAAQTEYLPTVSLGVEAGIQGERYGFSGDKPFGRASLTLEWNLFDGFRDRSRVQRRELEAKRLRTRRAHVEQQLALEAHKALEAVRVAQQSLHTAAARVTAARESFRLTRRRYDAERASQAALIDARTALTRAELNRTVTRYDLLIHLARLAHAAGLSVPGRR
jgi:outer membrane protein TolC